MTILHTKVHSYHPSLLFTLHYFGIRMCVYLRMNGIARGRRLNEGYYSDKDLKDQKRWELFRILQLPIDNNLGSEPNKKVIKSRCLEELKVGKRFILSRVNGLILKWWWACW